MGFTYIRRLEFQSSCSGGWISKVITLSLVANTTATRPHMSIKSRGGEKHIVVWFNHWPSTDMFLVKLALLGYTTVATAATVSSISSCPALAPRTSKATTVHDLRIDDIKVVAALGDRYIAI